MEIFFKNDENSFVVLVLGINPLRILSRKLSLFGSSLMNKYLKSITIVFMEINYKNSIKRLSLSRSNSLNLFILPVVSGLPKEKIFKIIN